MNNETSTLDSIIEEVRSELRSMLIKRQKLIQRLGYAFEGVVANPESICEEIKTTLRDEIAEKAISSETLNDIAQINGRRKPNLKRTTNCRSQIYWNWEVKKML